MTDENITTILTADKARERLDYDPETGIFLWKWRDSVKRQLNTRAGKIAGCANRDGYLLIMVDGVPHRAHRLAWLIVTGEWPVDQIDHVNGDPADNRVANLRAVNHAENMRNQAMPRNNTSGVVGVARHKATGKWVAYIYANGSRLCLGSFTAKTDAIAARRAAEITYGYHENHGRKAA